MVPRGSKRSFLVGWTYSEIRHIQRERNTIAHRLARMGINRGQEVNPSKLSSNIKVGNKVLFGAFWSIFGPRLDSVSMEISEWTSLKIRRLEISMCACKCNSLYMWK
ncbi:hypothetical protein DVH24_004748 [Malus domestica]|uniref:Uncharacterized protein n=1 Tax=Malus domestica TaxID=3750 RepID=A0A498IF85_MALDO|nr:hypothetical protein DVH24_004748 [Malus domestica]